MEAKVILKEGMSFEGTAGTGFTLPLGASPAVGGKNDGFRPMELILIGLASCTAMDVVSILYKKKQELTEFRIEVDSERAESHPKVFTRIDLHFIVTGRNIDPAAVDRAIELSSTKYCSAQAMLSKSVPIHIRSSILEAEA
jgi:putative redox protein